MLTTRQARSERASTLYLYTPSIFTFTASPSFQNQYFNGEVEQ